MDDFYPRIRRRFCEVMDWHPVDGGWERPIPMGSHEFWKATRELGSDWWRWKMFDPHLLTEKEMLEEIEFKDGRVMYEKSDNTTELLIQPDCIRLTDPVLRIAKSKTKTGKTKVVRQYHLPPGNQYDQRITRRKAEDAYELITEGMGVKSALKEIGVKWDALVKYTDYVPIRKVLKREAKRKCVKLIMEGMKTKEALDLCGISYTSLYKWSGGIRSIHNLQIKSTNHYGLLEWETNVSTTA